MNRWHLMLCALLLWVAILSVASEATPPAEPMKIVGISVDSVSLTRPLTLTLRVFAGYELKDVSAGILAGEGYTIESQVTRKAGLLKRGDTASFSGVIQPLAKGTWKVQVSAQGVWPYDTAAIHVFDEFYIHLSDTLNRVFSASDYIIMQNRNTKGKVGKLTGSEKTIYLPPGKRAKPAPRDSSARRKPSLKQRSGSFDVTGQLKYHDPRDGVDVYRPAPNVTVEVWNDNYYDNPSSSDTYLGTTITDIHPA